MSFEKSDMGAQAAWKGFSSQTLYIASRIMSESEKFEYFPERLEDLLIMQDGNILEIVQVKDLSEPLSISNLSSASKSLSGEGFYKRACSLMNSESVLQSIRVIYFGSLGTELLELSQGDKFAFEAVKKKLVTKHGLPEAEVMWLLQKIKFEKVNRELLEERIMKQVC